MLLAKVIRKLRVYCNKVLNWAEHDKYKQLYICTGDIRPKVRDMGDIQNKSSMDNISIGSNVLIDGIIANLNENGKIKIGDYSYVGPNSRIWSYKNVVIGNHVLISHNCNIFDSNCHPIDYQVRQKDYENILFCGGGNKNDEVECAEVIINDDVWIGANSCILKGVTIGARSIVGAGSVVTKSVPEDVIVAGNPAVVVKHLAKDDIYAYKKGKNSITI